MVTFINRILLFWIMSDPKAKIQDMISNVGSGSNHDYAVVALEYMVLRKNNPGQTRFTIGDLDSFVSGSGVRWIEQSGKSHSDYKERGYVVESLLNSLGIGSYDAETDTFAIAKPDTLALREEMSLPRDQRSEAFERFEVLCELEVALRENWETIMDRTGGQYGVDLGYNDRSQRRPVGSSSRYANSARHTASVGHTGRLKIRIPEEPAVEPGTSVPIGPGGLANRALHVKINTKPKD